MGSNNPMGLPSDVEKIPFHLFYMVKDLLGNMLIFVFIVNFFSVLFWCCSFSKAF